MLADLCTPVSAYLHIRDLYTQSALMESSDYHGGENGRSFIGIEPIAQVSIEHGVGKCTFPDGSKEERPITQSNKSGEIIRLFLDSYDVEGEGADQCSEILREHQRQRRDDGEERCT